MTDPLKPAMARGKLSDTDVATGAVLTLFGAGAAWMATGFDPTSRNFPLIVSGVLVLCGVAILLRALTAGTHRPLPLREFGLIGMAVGAVILWGLGLAAGAGFALSTFGLVLAMLWLAGMRNPGRGIVLSLVITGVLFAIFALLLNVHLPPSVLSFVAEGL